MQRERIYHTQNGNLGIALSQLQELALDPATQCAEITFTEPVTEGSLKQMLTIPYEVGLFTLRDRPFSLINGYESSPGDDKPRDEGEILGHTHQHPVRSSDRTFVVPDLENLTQYQAPDYLIADSPTPADAGAGYQYPFLAVVHARGVTLFVRPNKNGKNGEPLEKTSTNTVHTITELCMDFGIDMYKQKEICMKCLNSPIPEIMEAAQSIAQGFKERGYPLETVRDYYDDLTDEEKITFSREFAEKTGMILLEAEWGDTTGNMDRILDIINGIVEFKFEDFGVEFAPEP